MKKVKVIFMSTICALLLIISIYNIKNNSKFWDISFYNIITILIAIVVTYYFTQKNNNEKKKKEEAENILEKIQKIISLEKYYIIDDDFDEKSINMMKRTVNNKIVILEKISKELNIQDEINYIKVKFKEYRELIDEHITDITYLKKSSLELKKILILIDDKIDEIKLKLYT